MGKLKLIQGAFNGKVGEFYGTKQYRKHFIKAVPFSHTPHNEKQNQAFSAFGCLQRMSSQFVRGFWQYLGLSDKNMNKINAVAKWAKICVSNRSFSVQKIADVIPSGNEIQILNIEFSAAKQAFTVEYQNNLQRDGKTDAQICYAFIAANGQGMGGGTFYGRGGIVNLPTTWQEETDLTVVFFLSYLENRKRTLCACFLASFQGTARNYFDNGTFLADNFDWLQKPYFDGDVTVYPSNAAFEDETTVIS